MKRYLPLLLSLVLVPLAVRSAAAQNWPQFRGSMARGAADGQDLPVAFSAESGRNIRWKAEIPGLSHSSPVVWGDRIYLTTVVLGEGTPQLRTGEYESAGSGTMDEEQKVEHEWRLLSLEKSTGKVVWSKTVYRGRPRVSRHPKASQASATPATDGKRIVALFGSEGLYCFDMEGELLWKQDLGLMDPGYWTEPEVQWSPASSPVLYDNLVIVQNDRQKDSFLAAYDLESGEEAWRVERNEKPAWSTPALYRGRRDELITNSAYYFYSYDPATGRELWRFANDPERQVVVPSPVVSGDVVILTGGWPTGGNPVHAFRLGGSGDISPEGDAERSPRHVWKTQRWSPYTPTPLVYRGIVYVIVDNGVLRAFDFKTGERLYERRVAVGAGFSASPVASDGKVYLSSEDGEVYVVRAGRDYELLATNSMGEVLMATPAISGSVLIVRGRSHVYAIAKAGGTESARNP